MGIPEQEINKAINNDIFHLYNGDVNELLDSFIFRIISGIYYYKMINHLGLLTLKLIGLKIQYYRKNVFVK